MGNGLKAANSDGKASAFALDLARETTPNAESGDIYAQWHLAK